MIPSPMVMTLLILGLLALIAAAAKDLKDRIIPNGLVVFVVFIGLMLRFASESTSLESSVIGAGITFIVLAILAHRDFIGGGDAKLIAAATLLVPSDRIIPLLLDIALAGGLLSCFYLALLFIPKNTRQPAKRFLLSLFRKKRDGRTTNAPMPYAVAILGGVAACSLLEVLQCFNATSCLL